MEKTLERELVSESRRRLIRQSLFLASSFLHSQLKNVCLSTSRWEAFVGKPLKTHVALGATAKRNSQLQLSNLLRIATCRATECCKDEIAKHESV